jgi:hypothetical protein
VAEDSAMTEPAGNTLEAPCHSLCTCSGDPFSSRRLLHSQAQSCSCGFLQSQTSQLHSAGDTHDRVPQAPSVCSASMHLFVNVYD